MVGEYRYLLKLIFIMINEKNSIITNHNIIEYKTYYLPFLPSYFKRIVTHAVIEYEGKEISIYNTHLEVKNKKVKEKQLNKIYSIIKEDNRPKILMGDFNLKSNNPLFINFINSLEKLEIKRINFNEKTYKNSKDNKEIGHIFISNDFKLINKKVIKNLQVSDHYPLLAEIKLKN